MVRFKNRWLLVELIAADGNASHNFDAQQIYNALKRSILDNFGDAGWGCVAGSLNVKYFSPVTGICIIRVARDHHRTAWGALTLLTSIENQKLIPFVVHCSGTIKHCQLAAIQHNRETIAKFRARAMEQTNTPGAKANWGAGANAKSYDAYLEMSTSEINSIQD